MFRSGDEELELAGYECKTELTVGLSLRYCHKTKLTGRKSGRLLAGKITSLEVGRFGYHQMTYSHINNTGPVSDTEFRLVPVEVL